METSTIWDPSQRENIRMYACNRWVDYLSSSLSPVEEDGHDLFDTLSLFASKKLLCCLRVSTFRRADNWDEMETYVQQDSAHSRSDTPASIKLSPP